MHANFMEQLGIVNDTFLASYLRYLELVPNEKEGPAAWTEWATTKKTQRNNSDDARVEDEL